MIVSLPRMGLLSTAPACSCRPSLDQSPLSNTFPERFALARKSISDWQDHCIEMLLSWEFPTTAYQISAIAFQ
jgi:hypothetical protein